MSAVGPAMREVPVSQMAEQFFPVQYPASLPPILTLREKLKARYEQNM